MIFSALADNEFHDSINQSGVEYEMLGPQNGFEVRFDQDDVFQNSKWLEFLINKRSLVEKKGIYSHTLRCVAIHKSEKNGFEDSKGILKRIRELNSYLN